MTMTLPTTYTVRRPTPADAQAVADLMFAHDLLMTGHGDAMLSDVLDSWQALDLDHNAWLVIAEDGQVVGYEEVEPNPLGRIGLDGFVHPDHMNRGIGTYLMQLAEARAHELIDTFPPDAEIFLTAGQYVQDDNATQMMAAQGFSITRYYFRMTITLDQRPDPVTWPHGYTARPFNPDTDGPTLYDLHMRSFAQHYGFAPRSYETWLGQTVKSASFRPDVWFYVTEGDDPAGFCLNYLREDGVGWVGTLGVVAEHRRRGLGMGLLLHSFGRLYDVGARIIDLGVDASNRSGAVALYERAGMSVRNQYAHQEKIIRAGLRHYVNE